MRASGWTGLDGASGAGPQKESHAICARAWNTSPHTGKKHLVCSRRGLKVMAAVCDFSVCHETACRRLPLGPRDRTGGI